MNHVQSTATIDTANYSITGADSQYVQQQLQNYQSNIQNYINQNYPNATIDDIYTKKEIIKQNFTYLLGTLPYRNAVIGIRYSEIPDNLRYKITFKIIKDIYDEDTGTPIIITKNLPEIAGKKITLSYSPATADDEATINSYLPKPHADGTPIQPSELPTSLPAYLINLKPELRIDGVVVATGTAIGMGYEETFDMVFTAPGPNGASDVVSNQIDAGAYHAIAIDTGKISQAQMLSMKSKLEDLKSKLDNNNFTNITKDDLIGEILYGTALAYYAELDNVNYLQAKNMGVAVNRTPSESIFSFALNVGYMFGMPRSVSAGGFVMDVDRNVNIVSDLNGDTNNNIKFMRKSGMNSSALEHQVPEMMFSSQNHPVQAVSAVKALKIANDSSIPIFVINKSNVNNILPQLQLDEKVITDIQNAVNAGNVVTVSKTDITYNGWTGCGYIISDPTTGAGAYMIGGGLNGGQVLNTDDVAKLVIAIVGGSLLASVIVAALAYLFAYIVTTMLLNPGLIIFWTIILILIYDACKELLSDMAPDEYLLTCIVTSILCKVFK
ncbi:TolA protein [Smithella sp. ME-1]|nr:TolA protein [Smithella sp. ME-1]